MHPLLLKYLTHLLNEAKAVGIQRLVVGGLIHHNQKVLCLKRAGHDFLPGLYELPSGKVEKNEDLLAALKREVKEESNLDTSDIADYLGFFDYTSKSGIKTRQFNFAVVCSNYQDVKLNPAEHEGYSWLTREELNRYNISSQVKDCIYTHFIRREAGLNILDLVQPAVENGVGRFVAGAIIANKNKVLILKRASTDFMGGIDELPSGKVEAGESLETALVREVKEETGLSLEKILSYVGSFDYTSKSGVKTRQFTFAVSTKQNENVQLSEEHEGFAWISANEINRYQLSAEVKAQVNLFFQPASVAQLTEQSGIFSNKNKRKSQPDIADSSIAPTESVPPSTSSEQVQALKYTKT